MEGHLDVRTDVPVGCVCRVSASKDCLTCSGNAFDGEIPRRVCGKASIDVARYGEMA